MERRRKERRELTRDLDIGRTGIILLRVDAILCMAVPWIVHANVSGSLQEDGDNNFRPPRSGLSQ